MTKLLDCHCIIRWPEALTGISKYYGFKHYISGNYNLSRRLTASCVTYVTYGDLWRLMRAYQRLPSFRDFPDALQAIQLGAGVGLSE